MEALFIIVMLVAVFAAVAMLLSDNAVHSALFLIVNFACVALMYLMLDAPFLAMIQIAVYAGAIMVLFLFVIMLLGAEKTTSPVRRFRWLEIVATALGVSFAVVAFYSIGAGRIDLNGTITRQPQLRVVHAAPYAGAVDVYANGELFASNLEFGKATGFEAVAPGDYTITLNPTGTTDVVQTVNFSLNGQTTRQANTYTAVAYGGTDSTPPTVSLVESNLESVNSRTARVAVFNGYSKPVNLIDFGADSDNAETNLALRDDRVLLSDIQPGALVELPLLSEDASQRSWVFTEVNANEPDFGKLPQVANLNNLDVYTVTRDTSQVLVLGTEELLDGSTRNVAIPLVDKAVEPFGSPQSIGNLLFSKYMLPFQLIAILLLAAMVGAIALTHKEGFQPRRRDIRRKVMKPLTNVIGDQIGQDVAGEAVPRLPAQQNEPAAGD
ncbi:MAG: NADH-quinone oxidoreductase subunit J [Chloroflexi bacterium]|nr:NADH-quinone oxidoreductase subunit J [Chloroflexota bacterium]MCC6894726.1 NADH-quinone oxidoreductase subunit J [Anaerolineae bacterium]